MYRKFHPILDTHPELICRYNADFKLSFVNRTFADFFGINAEDVIGNSLINLVQEVEREKIKKTLEAMTPDKPMVKVLSKRTQNNGEIVDLEWTIIALYDDKGHLVEFQSLGRDVTQELKLKSALEERNTALEISQGALG